MKDDMGASKLDMNIRVGPDEVALAKKHANSTKLAQGNMSGNMTGNLTGNLSGNISGNATAFAQGNHTGNLTGNHSGNASGNSTALAQTSNPVTNPPFNNWSVNQPSVPHANGLAGKADLGQNIIVDGHHVHF
jgi:hypothetical protein